MRRQKRKLSKKETKALEKTRLSEQDTEELPLVKKSERRVIAIGETITVRDLARLFAIPVTELIKVLMKNGLAASINEVIDWETAAIVGDEFGIQVELKKEEKGHRPVLLSESETKTIPRPPVVTVMGHVDHGKTQLLDTIRQSRIIETEAGGITQRIGAYQVDFQGKKITFLDTPGHEAFEKMREHGANITDIIVLVVAADEGVKVQTIEACHLAKRANVPIIIAINKIDLPQANPLRVKQQLSELGLVCEEMGGETPCISISAKEKINIDELLEMILLVAELKDLKANSSKPATGVVIDSQLDAKIGPIAFVLVQDGILKKGDFLVAGKTWGRVRLIEDEWGHSLESVGPSAPVKIIGLKTTPVYGDFFQVVSDEKMVYQVLGDLKKINAQQQVMASKKGVPMVVKAETMGALTTVVDKMKEIQTEEPIAIVKEGIGAVTEDDVMTASATGALIVGFRVGIFEGAKNLAKKKKVRVCLYDVIYELLKDVAEKIKPKKEVVEVLVGQARVLKVFNKSKQRTIVGIEMTKGFVENGLKAVLKREEGEMALGRVISLKREKEKVGKLTEGMLGGIGLSISEVVREGDRLEFYKKEEG